MKRIKQNSKLKLGKEVVSNLTKNEQGFLQGGKLAATTSFDGCSGILCCNPTGSQTLYSEVFKCTYICKGKGLEEGLG